MDTSNLTPEQRALAERDALAAAELERRSSGVVVPLARRDEERTESGLIVPKGKAKQRRSYTLGDLMRVVLGFRKGVVSPHQAVTRRDLGLRSRRVRAENRERQARRAARKARRIDGLKPSQYVRLQRARAKAEAGKR